MNSPSIVSLAAALLLVVPNARAEVDFARQVHPILVKKCFGCHSSSTKQGGLSVETREALLTGGANGPAVVPNAAESSPLYQRVAGLAEPRMPMGMPPLTESEIAVVRGWIDEGAAWEESSEGPLRATAPLGLREVEPPASPEANPIDRFVAAYRDSRGLLVAETVSDARFLRRAYLDLWGFLPPTAEQQAFLRSAEPDKRAQLIDTLLADNSLYAGRWITFWNDLLRNDEGVVYHGGRETITDWLLDSLQKNAPYDRMVRELLSPRGDGAPEGFLIGVNWRGTVNASQTPPMQAAQNSAQVFLGVNLKCASCHDSFVNQWKLADSYGLASFFADEPLELVRCDAPTGQMAAIKFLFPELGKVDGAAPLAERREAVAGFFTAVENGRFARTIVNRYWKQLLGRGLVEPADDMDQPAWDPDLLDWLASDFVAHDYDLKRLLRRIMTSQAYQAAAAGEEAEGEYVFRGPLERRMSAEQFADSISSLTGEWPVREAADGPRWTRDWRIKATPLARAMGRPVRDQVFTERNEKATTLQALELLNGETLTKRLRSGAQRLLGRLPEAPVALWDSGVVGMSFTPGSKLPEYDIDVSGTDKLYFLVRDAQSYDPSRIAAGWANARLVKNGREQPIVKKGSPQLRRLELEGLIDDNAAVGGIPMRLIVDTNGAQRLVGKAGVDLASQQADVMPRVRFFVFGREPDLDRLTSPRGPSPIAYVPPPLPESPQSAVASLFQRALGRQPTEEETALALEQLRPRRGTIPTEGLEDLLWSVVLLPEFQVIR